MTSYATLNNNRVERLEILGVTLVILGAPPIEPTNYSTTPKAVRKLLARSSMPRSQHKLAKAAKNSALLSFY
jgi:hypothetical protein